MFNFTSFWVKGAKLQFIFIASMGTFQLVGEISRLDIKSTATVSTISTISTQSSPGAWPGSCWCRRWMFWARWRAAWRRWACRAPRRAPAGSGRTAWCPWRTSRCTSWTHAPAGNRTSGPLSAVGYLITNLCILLGNIGKLALAANFQNSMDKRIY